jgi:flagellar basal-body rod protein FlgB
MSLVDPTQQLLEAAMRGSWLRQTALTNNIANADTPNYRPQEVDFESTLQTAMEGGQSPTEVEFSAHEVAGEAGPNGAGVSIDQESAKLAENGLDYEALTQIAATRNSIVKSAIGIL